MKKDLLVGAALFFLMPPLTFAQKETNIWYFGYNAGLDFSTGEPIPLTDGKINTYEGCATLCDTSGKLLFYTDGVTVWDRKHNVMTNGGGLSGNYSSSQSAVVVPHPADKNLYFLFTTFSSLDYSIVDMSKHNKLGAVTTKNKKLKSSSIEQLTAVRHCNNHDVWVISHEAGNDVFNAFLITDSGVNKTSVVSHAGASHTAANSIGYLKCSPNGKKLASALYTGVFELFDFDNNSGVISNAITLGGGSITYGVEFSPDGTKLYGASFESPHILQFDLTAGSPEAIAASAIVVGTTTNREMGTIQLAPDGKIYAAKTDDDYLGVINDPNAWGLACNYVDDAVYLDGQRSGAGLPDFIQSYFYPHGPSSFSFVNACVGDAISFSGYSSLVPISWNWDFGDPASGSDNTSSLQNPKHVFNSADTFTVMLAVRFDSCRTDTIVQQVIPYTLPVALYNYTKDSLTVDFRGRDDNGVNRWFWDFGDRSLTSTEQNPQHSYLQNETFTVTLIVWNDCGSDTVMFDVMIDGNVGGGGNTAVQPMAFKEENTRVYPNPFSDKLMINFDTYMDGKLALINMYGALIKTEWFSANKVEMDTRELAKGPYLLTVFDDQHQMRIRKAVVKH